MGTKQFKQKTIQTKNKRYIKNKKNILIYTFHNFNTLLNSLFYSRLPSGLFSDVVLWAVPWPWKWSEFETYNYAKPDFYLHKRYTTERKKFPALSK